MTARQIATLITYLIAGLFALAGVLLALALQQLRRGRKGPYWRLRRRASQRGGILLLLAVGVFAISLALTFYSGLAAIALRGIDSFFAGRDTGFAGVIVPTSTSTLAVTLTPTATSSLIMTSAPTFTRTPSATATTPPTPTRTPSATATTPPTPTRTATATATVTVTVDSVLQLIPPVTGIPARRSARINITAAAEAIAADMTPIEPRTTFAVGIQRIYLFITYQAMDDGVAWSRVLYRNGQPIQGQAYLWSQGTAGASFFFFGDEAGYPAGDYEARLYLGEVEVSRFSFIISIL